MAFNPLALLHERQCAPIYNALDSGNLQSALKQCDGLLSSQPDLHLASALKAVALIRMGRTEEAGRLADKLIKAEAVAKSSVVLNPLCMVLSSLNRSQDEVELLDMASKAIPTSVETGSKAFLAMVKAKQWQRAQQTALRLHKVVSAKDKEKDEYFWSSMQAYSLIADDPSLPGHQLALPLAQRMIAKHLETNPFGPKSDEIMYLYATILRKQGNGQVQEALQLLSSDQRGKELCKRSMSLAALRYELLEELQDWNTIYEEALAALELGDRNWSRVQEVVKSAVSLASKGSQDSLDQLESRLSEMSLEKGKNDRTLKLAPLYLIKEARAVDSLASTLQSSNLLDLFTAYFGEFSTKACAYEDLAPYVTLLSDQEVQSSLQFLQVDSKMPSKPFTDLNGLYRNLNACKLARLMQPKETVTETLEIKAAQNYFALYLCALPLGKDLPKTEMQPADDYALLSVQALVHASVLQREAGNKESTSTLFLSIVILKSALKYSPKGYRLRVLLIRLLKQCGAADLARKEYEEIGVKAIQQDTLGWLLSSRSAFSTSLLQSDTKEQESLALAVKKLKNVWKEASTQVPQMVSKSFGSGIYSRVEEIVDFGERLEHSMTKWLVAVEMVRSTAFHSDVSKRDDDVKKLRTKLQECSASLVKGKVSDQQDYHVLLDLMPASSRSVLELTSCGAEKEPGMTYLRAMLPVALTHFDLPLQHNDAPISSGPDLTSEESALSLLAISLSKEDEAAVNSAISNVFQTSLHTIQSEGKEHTPGRVMLASSIALEAFELLQLVGKRKGRTPAKWDTKAAHTLLSSVATSLQACKWCTNPPIPPSQDWCKLLNQLPSTLRGGQDGQTLFRVQAKELLEATEGSRRVLIARIEGALKER